MYNAVIYTKDNCPYCVRAKKILAELGATIEEISAVEHRDALIESVTEITGHAPKTVPQIFLNGDYIGGHDDLVKYVKENIA